MASGRALQLFAASAGFLLAIAVVFLRPPLVVAVVVLGPLAIVPLAVGLAFPEGHHPLAFVLAAGALLQTAGWFFPVASPIAIAGAGARILAAIFVALT